MENIVNMGLRTAVRVLDCVQVGAPPAVAEALEIAPGEPVIKSLRVRSTEAGPLSYITTYVPLAVAAFTREDLERQPLLMLLESAGVEFGGATQTISARLADAQVAPHLDVAVGSALLAVTRLVRDVKERPVQLLQGLYRPDRYQYQLQLARRRHRRQGLGQRRAVGPIPLIPLRRFAMNTRRHFLTRSAAAAAFVVRALDRARQSASAVKIGVLHPVTGALAYSGQQCRLGALLAIEDINQAGGIKSLGGAPLEAVLGDAQSRPEAGSAEVEKMAAAGVSAVVGAYASAICLATTQTAAPRAAPCGRRGRGRPDRRARAEEHLSLRAGLSQLYRARHSGPGGAEPGRRQAGAHGDDRARGLAVRRGHGGAAVRRCRARLRGERGHQASEPDARLQHIVLRMRSVNPDIVIPANYYNEYALLLRAMKQQKVQPKAIYSVLGGAASSYKFLKEYPDVAHGIIDCNHWFNPGRARRAAEGAGGAEGRLLQLKSS